MNYLRLILIFFLISLSQICYSQDKTTAIGAEMAFDVMEYDLFVTPNFNIKFNNHCMGLGPRIRVVNNSSWGNSPTKKGLFTYYQYNINFHGVSYFIQYNFAYQYQKSENESRLGWEDVATNSFMNHIGVGFKFFLYEGIYFTTNYNYGITTSYQEFVEYYEGKYYESVYLKTSEAQGFLRLGLGYKF